MKNKSIVTGMLIGIIIGSVLGAWGYPRVIGTRAADVTDMDMGGMAMHDYDSMVITSEKQFLEEMIPHHNSAVKMAEQVLQFAKDEHVKTLAKNIISSQNKEINDMKVWLKNLK